MKSSRRVLAFAAILVIAAPGLVAQQCLEPLVTRNTVRRDSASRTFVDMQRAFLDWSRGRDLSTTKGWKWYKRWEAFNEQRANPDGSLADAEAYWRGSMQASAAKQSRPRLLATAGWSPVGPMKLATRTDPNWQPGMGRINCVAFHPTDSNTLWAGVAQGGVWKSVNGGASWIPLTDDLPILRISDIAVDPTNPDVLYISVGDYAYLGVDLVHRNRKRNTHYGLGVFRSIDGGVTWSPTGLGFALSSYDGSLVRRVFVHPDNPLSLLAAGTGGTWKSSDGGDTWTQGRDDLIWDIERVPGNPDVIYASTGHVASLDIGTASLLKSTDFGATWTTLDAPIEGREVQRIEIGIAPSDTRHIYAVACGNDETFYSFIGSTDGGKTWSVRADRSNGVNILGSQDGGQGDDRGQGSYDLAILVDPNDPDRVFVGGINIWGSTDGGASWNGVSFWRANFGESLHGDHHFFAWNPLSSLYYVCNDGGLYTTESIEIGSWPSALNDPQYEWPTAWKNISDGMAITSFYRLGLSRDNPGYVVAGAQDNSIYYTNGSQWWNLFGGDGMECFIDPVDPAIVYGSSQYGFLNATDDGGQSSRENLTGSIMAASGEQGEWTTPFAMDPTDRGTLYAGLGNVWKSVGSDTEWAPISSFPPLDQIGYPVPMSAMSISAADPAYIYCAKRIWHLFDQPSQAWMTADGGATWSDITAGLPDSLYLTYIATHGTDPATAWVTCGGFSAGLKVFKTTDAGATWTNISADLPNIPANCVVHDAKSALNTVFIGTDIGAWYTNDAISGWLPYGENLPNVIVSELEIHQGTRRLYAATFGRGVWMADLPAEGTGGVEPAGRLRDLNAAVAPGASPGDIELRLSGCGAMRSAVIEIVDVTGRQVLHTRIGITGDTHVEHLDLDLPYGMYFVRISDGSASRVVRFVVGE